MESREWCRAAGVRRCIPGWVASARLPVWYGGASRPGGRLGRLAGRTVEGPRRGAPPGLGTRRTQRRRLLRQRAVLLLRDGVLHEQDGERSMSADMSGIPQRDEGGKDENMTMRQEDSEARLAQSQRFMNDCKEESGGAGGCGHPDRDNTVGCEVLSSAHGDDRACAIRQEALGVQRICGETLLITRSSHPCMHRPSHRVSKVHEKKLLSASKK